MSARTPGPWLLSKLPDYGADVSVYAKTPVHKNPRWITRVYGEGPTMNDTAERDANAQFIVTACNAYDGLVSQRDKQEHAARVLNDALVEAEAQRDGLAEALREIVEETREAFPHNWSIRVGRAQNIARSALAKVRS